MSRTNDSVRLRITVDDSNGDLYQRFAGKTRVGPDAMYLMRLGLIYEKQLLKSQEASETDASTGRESSSIKSLQKSSLENSPTMETSAVISGEALAELTGIGADYFSMRTAGVH